MGRTKEEASLPGQPSQRTFREGPVECFPTFVQQEKTDCKCYGEEPVLDVHASSQEGLVEEGDTKEPIKDR